MSQGASSPAGDLSQAFHQKCSTFSRPVLTGLLSIDLAFHLALWPWSLLGELFGLTLAHRWDCQSKFWYFELSIIVWQDFNWLQAADPTLVPLLWDEDSYQAKPTIGFYTWWALSLGCAIGLIGSYRDGLLKPAPGCQRAVTEAVALLEKKGYNVVPIQGPDIHKVVQSGYIYAINWIWLFSR